jgi:thiol-disulfide isomerase/thioredoxin
MVAALIIVTVVLSVGLVTNFALTLALIRRITNQQTNSENRLPVRFMDEGTLVPDFSAESPGGLTLTRDSLLGRYVLLIFAGITCPTCKKTLPELRGHLAPIDRSAVQIVVALDGAWASFDQAVFQSLAGFQMIEAPPDSNPMFREFRIPGVPAFCLIGPDSKVLISGILDLKGSAWTRTVELLSAVKMEPFDARQVDALAAR